MFTGWCTVPQILFPEPSPPVRQVIADFYVAQLLCREEGPFQSWPLKLETEWTEYPVAALRHESGEACGQGYVGKAC